MRFPPALPDDVAGWTNNNLFKELNGEGQTVVMVIHNPENCTYADRTILLRDGRVVSAGKELVSSESCRLVVAGA